MHDLLFTNSPARDAAQLTANANMLGVDIKKFEACLNGGNGGTHAAAIRESIARMQQLGVDGTPLTLIGLTPAPGAPMKIVQFGLRRQALSRVQSRGRRGARTSQVGNHPASPSREARRRNPSTLVTGYRSEARALSVRLCFVPYSAGGPMAGDIRAGRTGAMYE